MSAARSDGGPGRRVAIAASVVVAATVVAAILAMGPPSEQRQVRLDQRRVQDLERIDHLVGLYVRGHDALPPDLATLASQPGQRVSVADPLDNTPYAYEVTGARSFRLCAVFATDTGRTPAAAEPGVPDEWVHGAGRQCFDRKPRQMPPTSR